MIDSIMPGVALALARHSLAIVEIEPYSHRPRRLILEAQRALSLGSTAVDEHGSPFAPSRIERGARIDTRLHISVTRARPVFGISRRARRDHELQLMYCIDGRLWMLRRQEAAAIFYSMNIYRPGAVTPNLVGPSMREDMLRVFPGSGHSDFDAATYVTVEPEEA